MQKDGKLVDGLCLTSWREQRTPGPVRKGLHCLRVVSHMLAYLAYLLLFYKQQIHIIESVVCVLVHFCKPSNFRLIIDKDIGIYPVAAV